MGTIVDNLVHVEIETIELWNSVVGDELGDGRISLAHPSEEFRDTHGGGRCREIKFAVDLSFFLGSPESSYQQMCENRECERGGMTSSEQDIVLDRGEEADLSTEIFVVRKVLKVPDSMRLVRLAACLVSMD